MNTAAQTLLIATASVAAAAALGVALANHMAPSSGEVVRQERVVVLVGHWVDAPAPVITARLPRVVIEQRRAEPVADVAVAQARRSAVAL